METCNSGEKFGAQRRDRTAENNALSGFDADSLSDFISIPDKTPGKKSLKADRKVGESRLQALGETYFQHPVKG